jgi:RNA polymerase sigma-70 factor (ECF subfamily)
MDSSKENQSAIFERMVRPHLQRLYRLSYRLTHSKPEAEDLFQDVLTKTFARLDDLLNVRDPGPWLNRVMYNHFVDNKRRFARQRLVTIEEGQLAEQSVENFAGDSNPQHDAERRDNIMQLQAALSELSDEHRTVLLLHDVEGYKLTEIQALTDSPVGTIKSRLHRARSRLRELLGANGTFFHD